MITPEARRTLDILLGTPLPAVPLWDLRASSDRLLLRALDELRLAGLVAETASLGGLTITARGMEAALAAGLIRH